MNPVINDLIDYSNSCDISFYYTEKGFLLQVFNRNDIYFSINKENCLITLKLKSFNEYVLNISETNLLGNKLKMRYFQNNNRLSKHLKQIKNNQLIEIKPMEFKCFLLSLK